MTDTSSRWVVHFGNRESIEVTCSPAADLAHVLRCYSDAMAAEPIAAPEQVCRHCEHFARPGLSDTGYCSVRADLTLAYGALRALPADRGAGCSEFVEGAL